MGNLVIELNDDTTTQILLTKKSPETLIRNRNMMLQLRDYAKSGFHQALIDFSNYSDEDLNASEPQYLAKLLTVKENLQAAQKQNNTTKPAREYLARCEAIARNNEGSLSKLREKHEILATLQRSDLNCAQDSQLIPDIKKRLAMFTEQVELEIARVYLQLVDQIKKIGTEAEQIFKHVQNDKFKEAIQLLKDKKQAIQEIVAMAPDVETVKNEAREQQRNIDNWIEQLEKLEELEESKRQKATEIDLDEDTNLLATPDYSQLIEQIKQAGREAQQIYNDTKEDSYQVSIDELTKKKDLITELAAPANGDETVTTEVTQQHEMIDGLISELQDIIALNQGAMSLDDEENNEPGYVPLSPEAPTREIPLQVQEQIDLIKALVFDYQIKLLKEKSNAVNCFSFFHGNRHQVKVDYCQALLNKLNDLQMNEENNYLQSSSDVTAAITTMHNDIVQDLKPHQQAQLVKGKSNWFGLGTQRMQALQHVIGINNKEAFDEDTFRESSMAISGKELNVKTTQCPEATNYLNL